MATPGIVALFARFAITEYVVKSHKEAGYESPPIIGVTTVITHYSFCEIFNKVLVMQSDNQLETGAQLETKEMGGSGERHLRRRIFRKVVRWRKLFGWPC